MKALKLIVLLVGICVTLPIGLYLQYKVLSMVGATDVMWLLFWVNIPVYLFVSILSKIFEVYGDE